MDQIESDKRVIVGLHLVGVFVHENKFYLAKDRSNWTEGRPLPLRSDLTGHTSLSDPTTSFGWGYAGAGARVLAASLIYDVTGSEHQARQLHVALAFGFLAFLSKPHEPFVASYEEVMLEIAACVDDLEKGRPMFGAPYATMPGPS